MLSPLSFTRLVANISVSKDTWYEAFSVAALLDCTRDLEGDIVGLGVGPGRFLVYCASWLKTTGSPKHYLGYDIFSGFPSMGNEDKEKLSAERLKRVRPGNYAFSKERIEKPIKRLRLKKVELIEGDFTETLRAIRPDKASFLYMDCDLYKSYKVGLQLLYDRVVPRGVVLFDEYEWTNEWPGARKAVDQFFSHKVEKPQRLPFSTSYYVVRGYSPVVPDSCTIPRL